ncbi:citrate lyase acyl carrier protein [Irregularibacter muris]|uniref:Citrate lyase acyl carrier protein n=1 Tax=Irregularibacter muris TaxID=1796619 RepID=A0AAE3HEV5_9FIRM|nr:citrate lyase acyl carrier protein [Irregularibacter muris]MCR1898826.1 citrate lyase acyl carrier protein [Irregularibacter muris]
MRIIKAGMAGTMESSDISIIVEPNTQKGIEIQLNSSVEKQFGNQIRKVITDTLKGLGISEALVRANDKGALDCIVKARTLAATYRAAGEEKFNWEELDKWVD